MSYLNESFIITQNNEEREVRKKLEQKMSNEIREIISSELKNNTYFNFPLPSVWCMYLHKPYDCQRVGVYSTKEEALKVYKEKYSKEFGKEYKEPDEIKDCPEDTGWAVIKINEIDLEKVKEKLLESVDDELRRFMEDTVAKEYDKIIEDSKIGDYIKLNIEESYTEGCWSKLSNYTIKQMDSVMPSIGFFPSTDLPHVRIDKNVVRYRYVNGNGKKVVELIVDTYDNEIYLSVIRCC